MLIPDTLDPDGQMGDAQFQLEDITSTMDAWLDDGWDLNRALEMVQIARLKRAAE